MGKFAKKLKKRMDKKHYSQLRLANEAHLDVRTVRRYLNPKYNNYQVETLLAMAKVLYNKTDKIKRFLTRAYQYPLPRKYKRVEDLIACHPGESLEKWNDKLAKWKEAYRIPRRYKSNIK